MNSETKYSAAPLAKARGVPSFNQNLQKNGDKILNTATTGTSTMPVNTSAGRGPSLVTENLCCSLENETCTRPKAEGQRFCIQHAKLDRDSIFHQCNYVSSRSGRRCFNITTKSETGKEGFCINHARLVTFYRRRTSHRNRFHDTPDSLLENVESSLLSLLPKSDAKTQLSSKNARHLLDYYSESSDDDTRETVADTRTAPEDSDMEVDDTDDYLKHAGVYTAEEVVRVSIDKMSSLRDLYAEYLNVLNRKYKVRRQKYLRAVRAEGEAHGPLSVLIKSYKDKKKLKQLKALRRYGRHFGKDALLYQQCKREKREKLKPKVDDELLNEYIFIDFT